MFQSNQPQRFCICVHTCQANTIKNQLCKLNQLFSSRQRASGVTLVFLKSTETSIFHRSEPTGLQAWVLLLVRQSDICALVVNHRISWILLFQKRIYDAAAYLKPSKARTFLTV